jgi:hypothetical protein
VRQFAGLIGKPTTQAQPAHQIDRPDLRHLCTGVGTHRLPRQFAAFVRSGGGSIAASVTGGGFLHRSDLIRRDRRKIARVDPLRHCRALRIG